MLLSGVLNSPDSPSRSLVDEYPPRPGEATGNRKRNELVPGVRGGSTVLRGGRNDELCVGVRNSDGCDVTAEAEAAAIGGAGIRCCCCCGVVVLISFRLA